MERKWWHEKCAYQIYPKSYMDSNGDGIGDIPGIISKLDYLEELGINLVWISPFYCSPLADEGYDISDYYNIDPRFGTMEDFDRLIAEAGKRGIKIVIDLVVNHCSDEHEWFKKACEDPDGPYGKFFYIEDHKEGDPLPCNWRSYFGGSCWEPLPGNPGKIYLHVFHRKQPDLNWENEELRKEIYKMMNFWLDKGIGGFRVDAIINIKKKLPFKDYPADREDGYCNIGEMLAEAEGVGEFLNEMADNTVRKYDAFSVGEVFNITDEDIPAFVGDNGYFSSMFDFSETVLGSSHKGWYDRTIPTPEEYKQTVFGMQKKTADVYISNIIENHDEPRGVSHYIPKGDCNDASKKMLGGLNFMLRGLPFIYQGQEIGMENFRYGSIEEADDISAIDEYRVAMEAGCTERQALDALEEYSRDNARSPFQWDDSANAGFSTGKPWLKVNPNYKEINLAAQREDPSSVWNFYKKLISIRKNPEYRETVVWGELTPFHPEEEGLMAYHRKGDKDILVVGNFSSSERKVDAEGEVKQVLLTNGEAKLEGNILHMGPYGFAILEM